MKKSKTTKMLLSTIPMSIIAMATPLIVACNKGDVEIIPTITVQHGTAQCTKIWMNQEFRISYTPANGYKLGTVTIKIGDKTLVKGAEDGYSIEGNVIIVKAKAVTSNKIEIKITSRVIEAEKLWSFTEPSDENDRKAESQVIGNFEYRSGTSIKYSFAFPGVFTTTQDLTGHTIKASATFTYNANQNLSASAGAVTWEPWNMDAIVTIGADNHSFTVSFEKTFDYESGDNKIWYIPGNTEIELSSFDIIDNDGTEDSEPVTCTLAYSPKIVPNLVFAQGGIEFGVTTNGRMNMYNPIYYVNLETSWSGKNCYGHFSVKNESSIQTTNTRFEVYKLDNYAYMTFNSEYQYANFVTSTLPTTAEEVGLELDSDPTGGSIWIKKEIGVGQPIKVKKV